MTVFNSTASTGNDIELSEATFSRIAKIAKSGWGLNLESAKRPLIRSRLGRRVKTLNLKDFDAYCALLESGSTEESDLFVSALTTNVTHFFREIHHFKTLQDDVLPTLLARAREGKRVRIWSAGCSTGQEPYSIAATLTSATRETNFQDLRILATDVDRKVLEVAEAGEYLLSDCNFPSTKHQNMVFGDTIGSRGRAKEELKALISFRYLNLVGNWPISGKFDAIMCRNVAIYFDRDTQNRLWSRFAAALNPGGYLFIGHSERIPTPTEFGFEPAGITTYQLTGDQSVSNAKAKARGI